MTDLPMMTVATLKEAMDGLPPDAAVVFTFDGFALPADVDTTTDLAGAELRIHVTKREG